MTARKKRGKAGKGGGHRTPRRTTPQPSAPPSTVPQLIAPPRGAEPPPPAPPETRRGQASRSRSRDRTRTRAAAPTAAEHMVPRPHHPVDADAPPPVRTPTGSRPRTPEAAFDTLYARTAGPLLRQVELLTGRPAFARRAVAHAFALAWQHWPEVARDSDPAGWLRAAAHEYALGPWQRWVPGRRPPRLTGSDPLEAALLALPPARRRAVLLHDGLGLDLRAAAAEVEASTRTTAGRITRAREALAAAVPEEPADGVPARLGALLRCDDADPEPPGRPEGVRRASERGARRRTVGAFALTGLIAALTTAAITLGPGHVAHPHPPRWDVPPAAEPAPDRTG